jgi:hypothetical protein
MWLLLWTALQFMTLAHAENGQASEGLLNKLLAPGPLIEGHKDLERSRCLECHTPRLGVPDSKCLVCHDLIKAEVLTKTGFHGLSTKTCIQCHSDHKGREFDSTKVDQKTFDHKLTGFPLEGKHASLNCTDCHTEKRKEVTKLSQLPRPNDPYYLGLKSSCVSCHAKDDVHFFQGKFAKKDCSECHGVIGWKPAKNFDHDTQTQYPITGRHLTVSCEKCHVVVADSQPKARIYQWPDLTTKTCENCHTSPHKKTFSPALLEKHCTECHTDQGWHVILQSGQSGHHFEHSATRFPLTGAHSSLNCKECHLVAGSEVYKFSHLKEGFCIDCHQNVHLRQFEAPFSAQTCTQCHTTQSFEKRLPFDHDTTDFKLAGKHSGLDCTKCHTPTPELFPLLLAPRGTPRAVHSMSKYIFASKAQQFCVDCHTDPHKGANGTSCMQCHNEQSWKGGAASFHQNFQLTGVHYTLQCNECHVGSRKLEGQSQNCVLCHEKDDIHGRMLPNCQTCHEQQFWEATKFKHSMTNFPLLGAHRTIDCNACHANNIYKGLPSTCNICHIKDALSFTGQPNHQLLLGISCSNCHNQFSFR